LGRPANHAHNRDADKYDPEPTLVLANGAKHIKRGGNLTGLYHSGQTQKAVFLPLATSRRFCEPPFMLKKLLPFMLLPLLAGCAAQFTNLSPRLQVRNSNNLYPVEVAMASQQQTLRWDSIKPQVVVNGQSYDMHPTMMMTNRWEGLVPAPADAGVIHYHYRFDFNTTGFGKIVPDSAVSPEYTLRIQEQ
jgi:hypothetical protein